MRERVTVAQEETGCYVYGVVPADTRLDEVVGLDEAEVRLVESDGVAVVLSPIALDRPPSRRAELLAHSRVVDALAAAGPVVPVRFGTITVDDEAAVEEVLGDPGIPTLLERLAEVVQLNLRATYAEEVVLAEVIEADPVVADLRLRTRDLPDGAMHPDLVRLGERVSRGLDAIREADRHDLERRLRPLTVAMRARPSGGTDGLLDVALLVERVHHEQVEVHLEELAEQLHPRVRLRLVGPVPPYDFVEDRSWV
jgi:hypothetical protein